MSVFGFFKRGGTGTDTGNGTAPVARERLKILLAHERATAGKSDLVVVLRKEILAAITKHLSVEPENVHVSMQCEDAISTLTVDVEIPGPVDMLLAATG
jgi:cell division topological specificity factor